MTDREAVAASSAIFVIREAHDEIYVAPSAEMAVMYVRRHHEADPPVAKVDDFEFFNADGQQLELLRAADGTPAGLLNAQRMALERRVWDTIRRHREDIRGAEQTSEHGALLQALAAESLTFDELTRQLAALAAQYGLEHVHDHGGDGEVVAEHAGTPLHNLCHALRICS